MLVVDILFVHYGWAYAVKMGKQLSMGMEIPMFYMYGLMPLFIIVCVSFGICTASESAGVAVLYSMIVGFFIYRELTWKDVWNALKKTLISSSIMIIIGFTSIFTWVLTIQKVPDMVANFFMGMCLNACNKINRMPIIDIFKGALPYVTCNVLVLIAISLFPALTTWLPALLGY